MTPSLREKKTALPPGNNQKTCFEESGYNVCKKNRYPLLYHQAVGIAAAQLLSPPDKFSILAHFCSRKPWFSFVVQNWLPIFLMNGSFYILFINFT
jgi:hypothetical protein